MVIAEAFYAMKAIKELRASGIKVELYPDNVKVGKQFQHADKRSYSLCSYCWRKRNGSEFVFA